nr:hypothetical protein [uncultured Oscillibacter sp.]
MKIVHSHDNLLCVFFFYFFFSTLLSFTLLYYTLGLSAAGNPAVVGFSPFSGPDIPLSLRFLSENSA